ncbi:MAG: hypothetical protein LBE22_07620 [Azoarcus sp.]|jgi:hypothetical protein|nr:hypothetical protein [Azoarcus sp.]
MSDLETLLLNGCKLEISFARVGPQGPPGDGTGGTGGQSPHIGDNGNWWIGTTDTGVKAQGPAGQNGEDGQDGSDGADGTSPHIDAGGNWFIGTTDTGVKAQGPAGQDGEDGQDGSDGPAVIAVPDAQADSAAATSAPGTFVIGY